MLPPISGPPPHREHQLLVLVVAFFDKDFWLHKVSRFIISLSKFYASIFGASKMGATTDMRANPTSGACYGPVVTQGDKSKGRGVNATMERKVKAAGV
jgi:hypothetical protein